MTVYNTAADSANTSVRAFLTKVGEFYLGRSFNTSSGQGKSDWERVKNKVFQKKCAYCDEDSAKLQIEHLIMFNRKECGLHHPGNIVPICSKCNKRIRGPKGEYVNWEEQLERICKDQGEEHKFEQRRNKIRKHIKIEKYPNLSKEESHAIRVIANSLYENTKNELEKSLDLYKQLDKAFVQR